MKCGGPITKLPRWLSRVKAGFVCDSCKTKLSAPPAPRRQAPPPAADDIDHVVASLDDAGLLAAVGDLADMPALLGDDQPVDEEVAIEAVAVVGELDVEAVPVAEVEEAEPPKAKRGRKPKAKPEPAPAPEPEPEEAVSSVLAKALKKAMKKKEPEPAPDPEPEPKKPSRKKKAE
jgi:hypothetical protein